MGPKKITIQLIFTLVYVQLECHLPCFNPIWNSRDGLIHSLTSLQVQFTLCFFLFLLLAPCFGSLLTCLNIKGSGV